MLPSSTPPVEDPKRFIFDKALGGKLHTAARQLDDRHIVKRPSRGHGLSHGDIPMPPPASDMITHPRPAAAARDNEGFAVLFEALVAVRVAG